MATTAAVLDILVKANTRHATLGLKSTDAQLRKTETQTKKSAKSFAALGTAAKASGVALAAGAAVGAKKAVVAATDLGEQINKTKVVFRGSEKDILRWSKSTATSLGISRREALAAASTFGNMLIPMGFARKEAGRMSTRIVKLSADLASFNNASPQDTLVALRAGLAGETEPLRRFGIFLNDARLKQEALNLGLKNATGPTGALNSAAKAQATYSLILKDSSDAQGDFQRTSGSLANQQRILKAQMDNLAATLGKALLPALTAATKGVNNLLRGGGGGVNLGNFASSVSSQFGQITRAAGLTSVDMQKFGAAFSNVWTAIRDIAARVAPAIRQIMQGLARVLISAVRVLSGVLTADFGLMWQGIKGLFSGAIKTIGGSLRGASAPFRAAAVAAFRPIGNIASEVFNGIKSAFRTVIRFLLARIGDVLEIGSKIPIVGKRFEQAKAGVDRLNAALDGTRKRKNTTVNVRLRFSVPGVGRGELPGFGGSGQMVEEGIKKAAQTYANRNNDRLSSLFAGEPGVLGKQSGKLGALKKISAAMGLSAGRGQGQGYRPGDPGYHGMGRAFDSSGPASAMMKFARAMFSRFGSSLKELIYTPMGTGIKNGRPVNIRRFYGPAVAADHFDHVHVAMQRGGMLPGSGNGDKIPVMAEPGEGFINKKAVKAMGGRAAINAINRLVPRFQKGGVARVVSAARGAGFKGNLLRIMSAVAMGESGGNPSARGDGGMSHGLWQIYTRAHPGLARKYNLFNPGQNAKAAMEVYRSQGLGAWTVYNKGIYKRYLGAVDRALRGGAGRGRGKGRAPAKPDNRIFQFGGGKLREISGLSLVAQEFGKGRPFTSPIKPRTISAPDLTGDVGGSSEPSGPSPAEQLAEQMKELSEQVAALKVETAERNRITSSHLAIGLRQAERALADMIAGQLGTMGAQRARTPGDGRLYRT